jgi:HAD superfamily hydrolase (TIGR01509 family)
VSAPASPPLAARATLRVVLLDMGGVLVEMGNEAGLPRGEADAAGRAALLALLHARGGRADAEDVERLLFSPWRAGYEQRYARQREAEWAPHCERLLAATGARALPHELLAAWFGPYGDALRPTPGAADVLAALRRMGLRLALVSNVALPGELYRERLAAWGIAAHLETMRFSLDSGSRKPAPRMVEEALAALGARAGEAAMVGDRKKSDIAVGRAAGTRTIWLRSRHAEGPDPDLTIDALAELPAAIVPWLRADGGDA